jgi:hypothetical protein
VVRCAKETPCTEPGAISAASPTAAACEPWCIEPCGELTGDVTQECAGCTRGTHGCHPGAAGFSFG